MKLFIVFNYFGYMINIYNDFLKFFFVNFFYIFFFCYRVILFFFKFLVNVVIML